MPISVLLPAFNAERYLEQSITSILNQSFSDFELIIINDGSTDKTRDIVHSFSDKRIRYYDNLKNYGLIYTLNRGINLATGKYIARMDADDISLPERFEKQISYMENNPDCVVLGSAFLPIDSLGKPLTQPVYRPVWSTTTEWFMIIGSPIAHPSVMYRTDIAKLAGGYNINYTHAEDYEFWTKMIDFGKVNSLLDILLKYRAENPDRVSEKYFKEQSIKTIEIRQNYFNNHFEAKMNYKISEIIQNPNSSDCDQDKNLACNLLYGAYKSILTNNTLSKEAKFELEESVFYHIKNISDKIVSNKYGIKVVKSPFEVSDYTKLDLLTVFFIKAIVYKIKRSTKKILAGIGFRKNIRY